MLTLRNARYVLFGVLLSCLLACTRQPPLSEQEQNARQKEISDFFTQVRMAIKNGDAEYLFSCLSVDSKDWFENIRIAARTEPRRFLENRPFFEILCIMALRIEQRLRPEAKQDPVSILRRTVLGVPPVRRSFTKHALGKFKISWQRAEVGLLKAPNTPVFFFVREGDAWKLDLTKSLPLILLGAESIARQKRQKVLDQAIYILEEVGGQKVLLEDLFD